MVHNRCRDSRTFDRRSFRDTYEYLLDGGLQFKAVQFYPFVTRDERAVFEDEARTYYGQYYPYVEYEGFRGFEPGIEGLSPRSEQEFYYPVHYMEPIPGNEAAIDLDFHSSESRKQTVDAALTK